MRCWASCVPWVISLLVCAPFSVPPKTFTSVTATNTGDRDEDDQLDKRHARQEGIRRYKTSVRVMGPP